MIRRCLPLAAALNIAVAWSAIAVPAWSHRSDAGAVEEALVALRAADGADNVTVLELLATEPDSARQLLRMLDERVLASDETCDDQPCVHLSRAERAAVHARLDTLPTLILSRRKNLDAAAWCNEAAVGLQLITGRETAVMEQVLALSEPHPDTTAALFLPVERSFVPAARTAFEHDVRAFSTANNRFAQVHTVLRPMILIALGKTPQPESLELLPLLLGRDPALDVQVLTQLISVARDVHKPLDHGRLERVRAYLSRADTLLRSQAVQALGRLRDYESVRLLIDVLSDKEAGVRTNAHWALRTITAMTLDPSPLPWLSWHQSQTRWWRESAPELLARVDHAGPAELVELLRELGSKRLFRHQLTERLLPLLHHRNPEIVLMTCSAIENLRSGNAAEALERLFVHESSKVRSQSRRTWRLVTGREPPPEALLR